MPPKPKPNDKEVQVNNPAVDIASFPNITQSETSLARFKDFILCGFNDTNNATGVAGASSYSGFSFSKDLGKNWTDGGSIPANPGGQNFGDPSLAVDRNGVFYYSQIGDELIGGRQEGVITVSTGTISPNKTITMNLPQVVGRGQTPAASDPGNQDKAWITVGPDADNPGNEALYVVWTDFGPPNVGTKIRFSKFGTGVTLTPIIPSQTIVAGANAVFGAFPVVDKAWNIYVFYESRLPGTFAQLNTANRSIRMAKSIDGGNTFPINVQVSAGLFAAAATDVVPCGPANELRPVILTEQQRVIRMFEIPQAGIGPDGTIYVVWNQRRNIGGTTFIDVFLAYSQNGGNNWTQVNISNNLPHAFFPSVAVNKKGAHIQYNRFNDPNNVGGIGNGTFGVFMKTFSLHKGVSKVGKENMVSTKFSQVPNNHIPSGGVFVNFDPRVFSCYMGEYNQVITGPGHSLLHAWGDNRNILNGQNNPDVFFRKTESKP
ncbi:hypothetical protein [Bacillus toyonensis]|uniref:hypothetical protein n=1 Tax=Bacillus toyonensis TaxID=155322 RepID=UPI000BF235BC|nr:hypothetical protein [Bacillus toyonensis]PEL62867.1 hypothetical protein CN633_03935 [Bacillus toyonensis]